MAMTVSSATPTATNRLRALERLIGNTPLLAIEYDVQDRKRTIYSESCADGLPNRPPRL